MMDESESDSFSLIEMENNGKDNPIEISLRLCYQTEKAICLSYDGSNLSTFWLPLSQIEIIETKDLNGVIYAKVKVPEWLADRKGLI